MTTTNHYYRYFVSLLHLFYLILAILLGSIVAIVQPPFFAPDEPWHWKTAVFRVESLLTQKEQICNTAVGLPNIYHVEKIAGKPHVSVPTGSLRLTEKAPNECMPGVWSPIPYGNVLSYPGYVLSRLLFVRTNDNALIQFYLTRILQLLLTMVVFARLLWLSWHTFYYNGRFTHSVFAISSIVITPLFLQQSGAVSADGSVNALSISLATLVLFWNRISKFDLFFLLVFGLSAAANKPSIFPITLACTFFALWKIGGKHQASSQILKAFPQSFLSSKNTFKFALIILILITLYALGNGITASKVLRTGIGGPDNPTKQVEFLTSYPLLGFATLAEGTFRFFDYKSTLSGLGWLDTPLMDMTVRSYKYIFRSAIMVELAIWLSALRANGFLKQTFLTLILNSSVIILGAISVNTLNSYALLLAWTPFGAERIEGLQPRYYLMSLIVISAALGRASMDCIKNYEGIEIAPTEKIESTNLFKAYQIFCGVMLAFVITRVVSEVSYTLAVRYW